jgi:ribose transport system permease protein
VLPSPESASPTEKPSAATGAARVAALRERARGAQVKRLVPVMLLAVMCLAFGSLSGRFLQLHNAMIILTQAVVLLVAALGMTFVIVAGSIDLSVGSIVALAALVAAVTSNSLGVLALVPCCAIGLVAGLLNGTVIAKGKVPSFIVTMGAMVVYRGVVLFWTRGALSAMGLVVVAHVVLNRTVFGRELRAVGAGERVAVLTGIRVPRVKIVMFGLLGLMCGMAGLLQGARTMAATSQLGEGLELDVIAAVVVGGTPLTGGIGTIGGTILGALIITILSNGMNMIGVDPYLQNIVKGLVLVGAVFVTIDRAKIGIIK